jgi:hypothetical protein
MLRSCLSAAFESEGSVGAGVDSIAIGIVGVVELSRLDGLWTLGLDGVVSWSCGCLVSVVKVARR